MERLNEDSTLDIKVEQKQRKQKSRCLKWLEKQVISDKSTAHLLNFVTLKIKEPSI